MKIQLNSIDKNTAEVFLSESISNEVIDKVNNRLNYKIEILNDKIKLPGVYKLLNSNYEDCFKYMPLSFPISISNRLLNYNDDVELWIGFSRYNEKNLLNLINSSIYLVTKKSKKTLKEFIKEEEKKSSKISINLLTEGEIYSNNLCIFERKNSPIDIILNNDEFLLKLPYNIVFNTSILEFENVPSFKNIIEKYGELI